MNVAETAARDGDGLNGGVGMAVNFTALALLALLTPGCNILPHACPHKTG
jgi:hypothetical protein